MVHSTSYPASTRFVKKLIGGSPSEAAINVSNILQVFISQHSNMWVLPLLGFRLILTRMGAANSTDHYPLRLSIQPSPSTHAPLENAPHSCSTGASSRASGPFLVNLWWILTSQLESCSKVDHSLKFAWQSLVSTTLGNSRENKREIFSGGSSGTWHSRWLVLWRVGRKRFTGSPTLLVQLQRSGFWTRREKKSLLWYEHDPALKVYTNSNK